MNEVTTQTFERRQQTISEKIVQPNEEVIKGQIRELVRGKRGGDADLLRSPRRAPDAHPHQQRDRAAEPGDPSAHPCDGDIPGRGRRPDAGLRPAAAMGRCSRSKPKMIGKHPFSCGKHLKQEENKKLPLLIWYQQR